ncbi:SMI1 / KNR4 family protein [Listeria monocytogenes]|nr:SMI1 / KNR4 family protein [Listeria monocytogenes]
MIEKLINDIAKIEAKYDEVLPAPATLEELEILKNWATELFGNNVPIENYSQFLNKVNSLQHNGLFLYGVNTQNDNLDIIENNEIWHDVEENKKYLFFGDGDISWYVWDSEIDEFQELDKPSGEVMETFESCNAMLIEALQTAIN